MSHKTENQLLAQCLKLMRADPRFDHAVIFKHSDGFTSGVPDVSVTMHGRTGWFEFKRAHPYIVWEHDLQRTTCRRLDAAGICRVIVYAPDQIHIFRPKHVPLSGYVEYSQASSGHGHRFVIDSVATLLCSTPS